MTWSGESDCWILESEWGLSLSGLCTLDDKLNTSKKWRIWKGIMDTVAQLYSSRSPVEYLTWHEGDPVEPLNPLNKLFQKKKGGNIFYHITHSPFYLIVTFLTHPLAFSGLILPLLTIPEALLLHSWALGLLNRQPYVSGSSTPVAISDSSPTFALSLCTDVQVFWGMIVEDTISRDGLRLPASCPHPLCNCCENSPPKQSGSGAFAVPRNWIVKFYGSAYN